MDEHAQASPIPVVLRVPSQGQVETAGQGGEGGRGVPRRSLLRSLLRSPVRVRRGERERAHVAEQVHLPQVKQAAGPARPRRRPSAGRPRPVNGEEDGRARASVPVIDFETAFRVIKKTARLLEATDLDRWGKPGTGR